MFAAKVTTVTAAKVNEPPIQTPEASPPPQGEGGGPASFSEAVRVVPAARAAVKPPNQVITPTRPTPKSKTKVSATKAASGQGGIAEAVMDRLQEVEQGQAESKQGICSWSQSHMEWTARVLGVPPGPADPEKRRS